MARIKKKERKNWFYSYNIIFEYPISEHAKIVYLYLCRCSDEEGQSFPSYKTIAEKCSISKRTAMRAVKELQEVGFLSSEKRADEKGVMSSNLYVIYDSPELEDESTLVTESHYPSDTESLPPVTESHHPSDTESLPLVTQSHYPSDRESPKGLPNEGLPNIKDYSVSQSKDSNYRVTGQNRLRNKTDGLTDKQNTEEDIIKRLYNQLNIDDLKRCYPDQTGFIDEIFINILEMYFSEYTKISGTNKPRVIVQKAIDKLEEIHIQDLITNFKEKSAHTKIKNPKGYIQAMIYNIAFENEVGIANRVAYDLGYWGL